MSLLYSDLLFLSFLNDDYVWTNIFLLPLTGLTLMHQLHETSYDWSDHRVSGRIKVSPVVLCLPDYLLWETAVDGVDVLLQTRARLGFDLLHLGQTSTGHEGTPSLTVMGQHLWPGSEKNRVWFLSHSDNCHWPHVSLWFIHGSGCRLTHFAKLAHHVFEDVTGSVVEEWLQSWQVSAFL